MNDSDSGIRFNGSPITCCNKLETIMVRYTEPNDREFSLEQLQWLARASLCGVHRIIITIPRLQVNIPGILHFQSRMLGFGFGFAHFDNPRAPYFEDEAFVLCYDKPVVRRWFP